MLGGPGSFDRGPDSAVQRAAPPAKQLKRPRGHLSSAGEQRPEGGSSVITAALGGLGRQSDQLGARHDLTPPAAVIAGSVPWKSPRSW